MEDENVHTGAKTAHIGVEQSLGLALASLLSLTRNTEQLLWSGFETSKCSTFQIYGASGYDIGALGLA